MLVIGSSVATDTYDIMEGRRVCMVSSVGGTAGGRAGYGSVMVGGISVVVGVFVVVVCGERRPTEKKRGRISSVRTYCGSVWPYLHSYRYRLAVLTLTTIFVWPYLHIIVRIVWPYSFSIVWPYLHVDIVRPSISVIDN
jgi:hypothetical protein